MLSLHSHQFHEHPRQQSNPPLRAVCKFFWARESPPEPLRILSRRSILSFLRVLQSRSFRRPLRKLFFRLRQISPEITPKHPPKHTKRQTPPERMDAKTHLSALLLFGSVPAFHDPHSLPGIERTILRDHSTRFDIPAPNRLGLNKHGFRIGDLHLPYDRWASTRAVRAVSGRHRERILGGFPCNHKQSVREVSAIICCLDNQDPQRRSRHHMQLADCLWLALTPGGFRMQRSLQLESQATCQRCSCAHKQRADCLRTYDVPADDISVNLWA